MSGRDCDQLIADYADLGVTCGYVGNLEPWGDQRTFKVFTKLATKPNASACDVSIQVFVPPQEHRRFEPGSGVGWWKGDVVFDTPDVRDRLDAIRARLERGELYRVGGFGA
jgi:hypothetical protein